MLPFTLYVCLPYIILTTYGLPMMKVKSNLLAVSIVRNYPESEINHAGDDCHSPVAQLVRALH